MSENIDHEAAKKKAEFCESYPALFKKQEANLCRAYLDMVAQRDYWRTIVQGGVGELPLENNAHAQGETA